jgi:hypothetical protein
MNLKYVSSRGNEYDLIAGYIHTTRDSDFHEYAWSADTTSLQYGTRVNRFKKAALELEIELIFKGKRSQIDSEIDSLRNEFEYDIKNKQVGKLYWNDWYLNIYVIDSSTNEYGGNYLRNKLKVYAPYPFWIRERTYNITGEEEAVSNDLTGKTYDYTYSYTYGKRKINSIEIESSGSVNFRLSVFGTFNSLNLAIGNHVYDIDYSAGPNDFITIDSRNYLDYEKKCYLQKSSGEVVNVFDYRNPNYELFSKLESGRQVIAYHGTGNIELTIFEERSEPTWTA